MNFQLETKDAGSLFSSQGNSVKHELFNIRRTLRQAKVKNFQGEGAPKLKKTRWQAAHDFIFLYMNSSTIHGLRHLITPKRAWFEYALWSTVIILAVFQTISQSLTSWHRYQYFPVVISIDRDYTRWNTTQAAIVLCPNKRINARTRDKYIKQNMAASETDAAKAFINSLVDIQYENLDEIPDVSANIDPDKYMEIIVEVMHDMQFESPLKRREILYKYTILETGICAAFNTELSAYTSPQLFFKKFTEPNATFDLRQGPSQDGELTTAILNANTPFNAQLSSPNDIPDVAVKKIFCPSSSYWTIALSSLETTCSEDVRSLSIEQRKCRFKEESNLTISHVYSYNLCRMECRQRLAIKYCSCAPHFYKKVEGVKTCDLNGLRCLAKYKAELIKLQDQDTGKKLDCYCLPTCLDVNFIVENAKGSSWFMGTSLKYGFFRFPKTRVKRELIFGLTDLIVSIGATAGLFLGCSLLSFVELIYFFTLRAVCSVHMQKRRKSKRIKISTDLNLQRW